MAWLTSNWQLKVLALLLSLGLFTGIAFSQNPFTVSPVDAKVEWNNPPADLILTSYPQKVRVTIFGLTDQVNAAKVNNGVVASVDLSGIKKPGQQIQVFAVPKTPQGITANENRVPFYVDVELKKDAEVQVKPRVRYAPGWQPVKETVTPGIVHVVSTESFIKDLQAYVTAPSASPVQGNSIIPNLDITFEKAGKPVTLPVTLPRSTADAAIATLDIQAQQPNQSRKTTLVETPTGNPAAGYRITAVIINPLFIDVSGPAGTIAGLDSITLPPVGVDGATGDVTQRVQVPLPAGVSTDPKNNTALVTVRIQKHPAVQPSPSP